MNIMFLDFDGVIFTERATYKYLLDKYQIVYTEDTFNYLYNKIEPSLERQIWSRMKNDYIPISGSRSPVDNYSISLLNDLYKEINYKVVVSSAWRVGRSVEQLQVLLADKGFIGEVIGKTGSLNVLDDLRRGKEIQEYFDTFQDKITNFVIVDDEDYDIAPMFPDKIVKVNGKLGLMESDISKIKNFFI